MVGCGQTNCSHSFHGELLVHWFQYRDECVCLSLCSIGRLRRKLDRSNLTEVAFMIVNEQEAQSRAMYWELERRTPPGVPVYQQSPFQKDVWEALDGDKDDFLVYDR